jgi:hypothetical protein
MKHWEGRFDQIILEDRNLPVIAEKRVLRPKNEASKAQLQTAFETSTRVREDVLSTLLTSDGDKEMFRRVYPFSPALVQALVALSSVLQRERTALKVMIQLLVNQRDTLQLGQIVPVGDLYDVIEEQAEPFTSEMREHFNNARKLYRQKLLPMLEKEHGVREEAVRELPITDPKRKAFFTDDRLVKTLLLSALVPDVECFKGLNASRLTSLNQGNVRSPIPGRETGEVLRRCRKWAGQVGEIKIGEEPNNPTINVQLSGVDIETILEKARNVDNPGSRQKLIRQLLFKDLNVQDVEDLLGIEHQFSWRGTTRSLRIKYQNVRDMVDEALRAEGDEWLIVIDYPFDDDGHTPSDDLARLQNFISRNEPTRTLCWLPSFFSMEVQRDLGNLVVMEHVLASDDRFRSYADHLSEVERASARSLMDNQRSQLKQHVRNCLEGAYGITHAQPGMLDGAHNLSDHFQSLDPTFNPQPPVGANFKEGFQHLVKQALVHQFPAHPKFEADVRTPNLRKVMDEVAKSVQTSDGRIGVERTQRALLRQIANPLKLGEMHETHFVLGNHWRSHFDKKIHANAGKATVKDLRIWTDDPSPMGLPTNVQNLLIIIFAQQTNRVFLHYGGAITPTLENLADEATLHLQELPEQGAWEKAVDRAARIFGVTESDLCNATNVVNLGKKVEDQVTNHLDACHKLASDLHSRMDNLGIQSDADRRQSADSILSLLERLRTSDANSVVTQLAEWNVSANDEALGSSMKKASRVLSALEYANWELLEAAWDVDSEKAQNNRQRVIDALTRDELVVALGPVLKAAESEAVVLLKPPPKPVISPRPIDNPDPPPLVIPKVKPGHQTFASISKKRVHKTEAKHILKELEQKLDAHPNAEMTIEVRIEGEEE